MAIKQKLLDQKDFCSRKFQNSVAQVDFRSNLLGFCFRISQKHDLGLLKSAQV
jgi:hypothetical protein